MTKTSPSPALPCPTSISPALISPEAHPGYALAQAWAAKCRRPSMAEALAQTDDAPPPPDELEAETSGELNLRWLPPSDDVAPSSKAGKAGSKRPGLPMDLVLILSLAKAIEAAGGAAPGAPSQITRIEGRSPMSGPRDTEGSKLSALLLEAALLVTKAHLLPSPATVSLARSTPVSSSNSSSLK